MMIKSDKACYFLPTASPKILSGRNLDTEGEKRGIPLS